MVPCLKKKKIRDHVGLRLRVCTKSKSESGVRVGAQKSVSTTQGVHMFLSVSPVLAIEGCDVFGDKAKPQGWEEGWGKGMDFW